VSGLLRCRGLPVTNLLLDQPHSIIVTEIHSGKLERRLVPALFEQARIVIKRDQRQKALGEMFPHTNYRSYA
jgi:hypothetical protein